MDFFSSPKVSAVPSPANLPPFASPKSVFSAEESGFVTRVELDLTVQQLQEQHGREMERQKCRFEQIYSEKMREFEEVCLSQYRSKVKELENSHFSSAKAIELQAQLEVYEANEALLTKKWENKVIRLEKALEMCKNQLLAEKTKTKDLISDLESKNYQLNTVLDQFALLKSGNEAKEMQDKGVIEQLTGNYKRLAMELAEEKLKNRQNSENSFKIRISDMKKQREELRNQVKSRENELMKAKEEIAALKTRFSPVSNGQSEEIRREYEAKIAEIEAEAEKWRGKSVVLVTKMYPVLKQLRVDISDLKRDSKSLKAQQRVELKSVLASLQPVPTPSQRSTSQKRLPLCL